MVKHGKYVETCAHSTGEHCMKNYFGLDRNNVLVSRYGENRNWNDTLQSSEKPPIDYRHNASLHTVRENHEIKEGYIKTAIQTLGNRNSSSRGKWSHVHECLRGSLRFE